MNYFFCKAFLYKFHILGVSMGSPTNNIWFLGDSKNVEYCTSSNFGFNLINSSYVWGLCNP